MEVLAVMVASVYGLRLLTGMTKSLFPTALVGFRGRQNARMSVDVKEAGKEPHT